MKKIISILLATIMVFSLMPITAMAEDVKVDNNEVFSEVTAPDYSAYESIVKLVKALDEKEYTKESIEYVKSKVVPKESLETQKQINDAVAEIATAYAQLEKNSFKISFIIIDSNENEQVQSYTYFYGDNATLTVDNGEEPYKWIISNSQKDTKIESNDYDLSLIVDNACTVVAFTDTKPEEKHQLQQVKFLSFSGKLIHIEYTENAYDVAMPEAPELPFYYFIEWVKLNDNTYQAKYLSDSICDGVHHRFTTMVAKAGCETYGYVIFQCSCGEAYSTDYCRPTGHSFEESEMYCTNGCGKVNPIYDEEESSDEGEVVETPTAPTKPEETVEYGFDEGGYNNMVIAP